MTSPQPSKQCEVCPRVFVKRPKQAWVDWRAQRTCGMECRRLLRHPWRNQRGSLRTP